jgi:hypothetical protein
MDLVGQLRAPVPFEYAPGCGRFGKHLLPVLGIEPVFLGCQVATGLPRLLSHCHLSGPSSGQTLCAGNQKSIADVTDGLAVCQETLWWSEGWTRMWKEAVVT